MNGAAGLPGSSRSTGSMWSRNIVPEVDGLGLVVHVLDYRYGLEMVAGFAEDVSRMVCDEKSPERVDVVRY